MKAKPFEIDKRVVLYAWRCVKENKGAAGVDKQSLADFEANLENNLYKLWNRMSSGSYFPPPVKALKIPKKTGGKRVLGIPTVADRVAQMVVKLAFEPQVEPHFLSDSYGYRPNKSALDAVGITRRRCWKYNWVLEFDIKGLFDHIPHDLLLKAVHKHTKNPWVLLYIKRWLTAPQQLEDGRTEARDKGTPQGGVISPLLANLFLHYVFDKWMQKHYPSMVWCRYADDGLVHCSSETESKQLLIALQKRFQACGLELHPQKTKIVYCKDGKRKGNHENTTFDFLGYTFRRRICENSKTNLLFLNFTPAVSKTAQKAMRSKIRKMRIRSRTDLELTQIAQWLNPVLFGWMTYYGRYYRSALRNVFRHVNKVLVRWIRRKYEYFRKHKICAIRLLENIVGRCPRLFAHWCAGMTDVFA